MLLTRVRVSPWRDLESRWSSGRVTASVPSSSFEMEIGSTTEWDRVPLGPLTVTVRPSIVTSTPVGTGIGILPIRDMRFRPLPDVGEDFPAPLLLGGLPVGQQTGRGRDDGDTEAAENLRQLRRPRVDAQAGLGDGSD